MMFFNLLSSKDFYNNIKDFNMDTLFPLNSPYKLNRFSSKNPPLAYILKDIDCFSGNKASLAMQKMKKKTLGSNLLDDVWSQDIFLSSNSKLVNKYTAQINSLKVHKDQNSNKSLVLQFSKCLFNGSIQVTSTSNIERSKNSLDSIQYSWAKSLKLKYVQLNNLFNLNDKKQKHLSKNFQTRLNLNKLPLFVVSNHLGQMVISEPPTDLTIAKHFRSYSSKGDHYGNTYYGFFFTSYKDAQEYMKHIKKAFPLNSQGLKVFTCSFNTYYNSVNNFDNNICFKLIPDLIEISELIKKYRYHQHISFHEQQVASRNHFKGQPLYLIQSGNSSVTANFPNMSSQSYNLLTLNYKEAVEVFHKFTNNQLIKKKKKLNIVVYNLEDFIQCQLKLEHDNSSSFLILPSKSSYLFTKHNQVTQTPQLLSIDYLNILSSISLWSKRIFWSLTSKQPAAYF